MTHKNKFLFYFTCMVLLSGCGEELTTGVTKGGTGNGGEGEPIIGRSGEPLNKRYEIWLPKPVSDYCHGVKRTLSFIHPVSSELIQEDQLIKIDPADPIDNQIIAQVRWENQSDQPKTVLRSACNDLLDIVERPGSFKADLRCDVETVTLNKNDVYISEEYQYNFIVSTQAVLRHNETVQFLPEENNMLGCDVLEIPFALQNEQN